MSIDKSPVDSRALVSMPETNVEALAIVPMKKSKRSEAVQRRIRRPFSVSEVEALVQAVEKLGTGRYVGQNSTFKSYACGCFANLIMSRDSSLFILFISL